MRRSFGAALVSIAAATLLAAATAEQVDAETLAAVFAVAASKYDDPDAAEMRNVFKSRARNGMGYCGEIRPGTDGDGFTVFHALLESALGPSVLLLSDFPESDQSPNAVTVRQLMHNFGCVE